MKRKVMIKALFASSLTCALVSQTALADLQIYSANIDRVEKEAKIDGRYGFYQSGSSGEEVTIVKGFGNNMPLGMSLETIVPKTWKVTLNEGADKMSVNWKGGTAWSYVLEDLARKNNLKVNIDWSNQVVDVYSQDIAMKVEADRIAKAKAAEKAKALAEERRIAAEERKLRDERIKAEKAEEARIAAAKKAEKIKQDKLAKELEAKRLAEAKAKAEAEKIQNAMLADSKNHFSELVQTKEQKKANLNKKASENVNKTTVSKATVPAPKQASKETVKEFKPYVKPALVDTAADRELFNKSSVRPIHTSMAQFMSDVYQNKINESTELTFVLKEGLMLSENLNNWAKVLGWSFERNSKVDYLITRNIEIKGNFIQAVGKTVEMYKDATKPLKIEMHRGNKVMEMKEFNFMNREVGAKRVGE